MTLHYANPYTQNYFSRVGLACRAGVFGCIQTRVRRPPFWMRRELGLVEEGKASSSPSESFLVSPQPSVSFIIQDGGIEYSYPLSYPLKIKYACSAGLRVGLTLLSSSHCEQYSQLYVLKPSSTLLQVLPVLFLSSIVMNHYT